MLTCPQCKKKLPGLARRCPTCQTDLSLLVDYTEHLQGGVVRAEALTRAGELGEAVWAYLEVLEVDPDNAAARRQVGDVAAAVRHFDRASPARRLHRRLARATRPWLPAWAGRPSNWLSAGLWALLVVAALVVGYALGYAHGVRQAPPVEEPAPQATP